MAIDAYSRVAYLERLPDQTGSSCAGFARQARAWFADQGVQVERAQTDNAMNYVNSRDFKGGGDNQPDLSGSRRQDRLTLPGGPSHAQGGGQPAGDEAGDLLFAAVVPVVKSVHLDDVAGAR